MTYKRTIYDIINKTLKAKASVKIDLKFMKLS